MPLKDKIKNNEYMSEYMLKRYRERRIYALKRLGKKCARCHSTKRLEIDHIDSKLKSFPISKLWGVSWERFIAELDKCQLLCNKCHREKTTLERGQIVTKGKNVHGTLTSYRYCKCKKCKAAKAKYTREYRIKNGR